MKILIADPHPEILSALRLVVDRIPEITQVSDAGSLVGLLAQCALECPDLILLDLELSCPSRSRIQPLPDMLNVLHRLCPHAKVMVMSSQLEGEQAALKAGANDFFSKMDPPEVVLSKIVRFSSSHSQK